MPGSRRPILCSRSPGLYARANDEEPQYNDTSTLSGGVALNLTLVGDGIISSVYTLSVQVGTAGKWYPLQIDTGSSDSWIVSSSCPSQSCTSYSGPKYDPTGSNAVSTGRGFEMKYLQGYASGPIWWDEFILGPYALPSQAFGAVTTVWDELMSLGFSGILALSFPQSSRISQEIPPIRGDSPDGAPIVSNLFGLGSYGPREHFLSILLERPGMSRVPSVLGIGKHPSEILSNITPYRGAWESALQFSRVIMYEAGTLFWAAPLTGITAYVNGTAVKIPVGASTINLDSDPIAVFDTGIPFIFGPAGVVDALYGAYGIGPGTNGQYYVPCSTPVNMTISIGSQTFPIHPLDVTFVSKSVENPDYCISAVQASGSLTYADFVLGAAFMRNTYTVLSYDRFHTRALVNVTISDEYAAFALLSITNITQALDEFNTIRIQHRPLPSSSASPTPGTSTDQDGSGKHGLGKLWALIGISIAFGLIVGAFVTRWWIRRRRAIRRASTASVGRAFAHDIIKTKIPVPIALAGLGNQSMKSSKKGRPFDAEEQDENTLHSRPDASFMTSSTNTRAGEWMEPDFAEMTTGGPTPHNQDGEDSGPHDSARSRTSRSRSRGPSIYGGSLSDPTMLVTDTSILTNIPTLGEITPEVLSSSRYPTFARHHHHTLPHQPPLATVPIYEAPTPPESESTHQHQPASSPPSSPSRRALHHPLSLPVPENVCADGTTPPARPLSPLPEPQSRIHGGDIDS